jgi:hypothetical protein
VPSEFESFGSSDWSQATDTIIALRSAAGRQYGYDETTRDRNNQASPFTPRELAQRLIVEWSSALHKGVVVALYKPNDVMRRYDVTSDELLAKLANAQNYVEQSSSTYISGPASALLWPTLIRAGIALDGLGVVPKAITLAAGSVVEVVEDVVDTVSDALPDLPKFPVVVIGLVALVALVVLVKN